MTIPINVPKAPLSALDLFSEYPTSEDYQAASGVTPPPFDTTKPLKSWADPGAQSALNGLAPNGVLYFTGGAVYPILDVTQTPAQLQDGTTTVKSDSLFMTRDQAAAVNLPSKHLGYPGSTLQPAPVPRRALDPAEEIRQVDLFEGLMVINKDLYRHAPSPSSGFTDADRTLLQAIAAKLGVS